MDICRKDIGDMSSVELRHNHRIMWKWLSLNLNKDPWDFFSHFDLTQASLFPQAGLYPCAAAYECSAADTVPHRCACCPCKWGRPLRVSKEKERGALCEDGDLRRYECAEGENKRVVAEKIRNAWKL
jgi:hypothetical protein